MEYLIDEPETKQERERLRLADDTARILAKMLMERGIIGQVDPEAVSYNTAGRMLEVSGRTIRKMADRGELALAIVGAGSPRILVSSIRSYLAVRAARVAEHRARDAA